MRKCSKCGGEKPETEYYRSKRKEKNGEVRKYKECKECFQRRMNERHAKNKRHLVNRAGAKCTVCGYDRCYRALVLHHPNPAEKEFGIAKRLSAPVAVLEKEADKCVLLCSNCHIEEHVALET